MRSRVTPYTWPISSSVRGWPSVRPYRSRTTPASRSDRVCSTCWSWSCSSENDTASITSPMQCMMKEICAQCLQPHLDPATGKTSYVFSCFNQDQPLDQVDFSALAQRLAQNGVQEKLTALWIGRCLKLLPPPAERKAA